MTTMDRIAAHKASGVLFAWQCTPYSDTEVMVIATIDVSGKGRYKRVEFTGATFEQTMRTLADQCDALPGAGRGQRKGLAA